MVRRPNRSLSGPETIIPSVAVSVNELTAQPSWIVERPNSSSMNRTTPEMTEASKPMRKPPSATINAVRTTKNRFGIDASFQVRGSPARGHITPLGGEVRLAPLHQVEPTTSARSIAGRI
jgi:hypothetical protein